MATDDQVLLYHQVSEHKFEISGLRTGSIRDQMLRAMLVTEALFRSGMIDETKPLVVLGAGASGVTSALTAARHGVSVTIFEKRAGPFLTQMNVLSRRLDPVEFDWPHPHWDSGTSSWPARLLPLIFRPELAHFLALDWETTFNNWMDAQKLTPTYGLGIIEFLGGVDARSFQYDELAGGVRVSDPASPSTADFGAAISCIGFSGEKVEVSASPSPSPYRGYEFWGEDPIDEPMLGLSASPAKVLVSGGGDGAQQDFLRVLTGDFGINLYRKIAAKVPLNLQLLDAVLAEDRARRAYAWRRKGQMLKHTLQHWNTEYIKVIEEVWKRWTVQDRADLRTLLRPNVDATWILGGDVPDFCYGLNRLLSQLIARLHAEATGRPYSTSISTARPSNEIIVRGYWLQQIQGPGPAANPHVCGNPENCLDIPHTALVSGSPKMVSGDPMMRLGQYNLIIVRHGVDQTPLFRAAPISEQIVPMDIPI